MRRTASALVRLALLGALALSGCAAHAGGEGGTEVPEGSYGPGNVFQIGKASYYADTLAGRPTASGEPYDPGELTAAHRTLPLGSVVEVTRPDGRTVTVRVNDRGPYAKGRIIDLSHRAADAIGMVRDGVAEVSLRVIMIPAKRPRRPR